jgi:peptide/nickel transport system permease protein
MAFLARRMASALVVLWGTATIIFFLSYSIPSDPARAALGQDAPQEQVDRLHKEMGLDKPLYIQYGRYLERLVHGDLGESTISRQPVTKELGRLLPATFELVIPSLVLSLLLGVMLGVVAAVHAGHWQDRISQVVALFGLSMPVFWLGLLLQFVFYGKLGWLPLSGRLDPGASPPSTITGSYVVDATLHGDFSLAWDAAKYLILPTVALTTWTLPLISRLTRSVMLEVMRNDYVRTARSKGLSERVITYRHALRNALIPVVTVFGLQVGSTLGGAVVCETVFGYPGAGRALAQAVTKLDYPVITGFTLVICLSYIVANLLVDVSYVLLDPRIKLK